MRFEPPRAARFLNPKVIAGVIAVTGLLYGLEGFWNDTPGRPNAGDRVLVVVVSLFVAHLVWSLGRMRKPKAVEHAEEPSEA